MSLSTPETNQSESQPEMATSATYTLSNPSNAGERVSTALWQQEAFGREHGLDVRISGTTVTINGNAAKVQEAINLLMAHGDRIQISKVDGNDDETPANDDTVVEDHEEIAA